MNNRPKYAVSASRWFLKAMDGTPSGWPTTTSASIAANCATAINAALTVDKPTLTSATTTNIISIDTNPMSPYACDGATAHSHLSSMSIWIPKRPDIASVRDSVAWTIFIYTSSPLANRVGAHTPDNLSVSSGIDCSSGLAQTSIYRNQASKKYKSCEN